MRRLIAKVVLFAALLVALDRLVYAGAIYLRDHAGHPEGINLIYDHGWNPDIAFFGDSRTRHNFDMREIESKTGLSAYNFGQDGASPEESLVMLEEFLRNGHHPRVVVFEADPGELDAKVGIFDKAYFRDHLSVVPDAADLLRDRPPTLQQRLSDFAVTWLVKTASLPNRLPDLWRRWSVRDSAKEADDQPYPCGAQGALRCEDFNGSSLFLPGYSEEMQELPLPYNIDQSRMKLYEYVAAMAEDKEFWLILDETPRLHGDEAYSADTKARSEAFYCGLAKSDSKLLYARLSHKDGVDLDPSLYFNWTHFNSLGAKKMSDIIAPMIVDAAQHRRGEPCVLE